MSVGSKLYVSWLDFCVYLSAFEGSVCRGASKKMDYRTWRKLKYDRENKTQVIIEKCSDSFIVIIGHEDEYHRFYRDDESFGDFLFENLIDVKDYERDWSVYRKPLTIMESAKNVAVDCGEALKASVAITKDKLANIGIAPIAVNAGSSISCVIDTKVDKAEFDSKLEALSDKIQAVADKYNNIDEKENSTMKGFNFDFGPMNSNVVRMSIYGLAVKNKTGSWVAYDAKNGEIMDVDVFNFDGSKFMYRMPVAINDVAVGDVIVHMSVPMFIVGKSEDGKAVYAVDPVAGERKEIMLTKSPFGFNFVTKVVNFLGGAFDADASNPFGNLGLMAMLSEDNVDMRDVLPFMLMANSGNANGFDLSNPMVMYMMCKDGAGDLPMMLALSGAFNKPAAPHVCNCGQCNQ